MQRYVLYEQAHTQLKKSGILERLDEAEKVYEHVFESNVPSYVQGIYNQHKPLTRAAREHFTRINKIYADPDKHAWRVHKPKDTHITPTSKDQLVLAGWPLKNVLSNEAFYNHKRFGFENHAAFIATASAYIQNKTIKDHRPRRWKATNGSRLYETEVTGTTHGDLRINRTDITAYPAHLPLGIKAHLRPLRNEDRQIVQAYHSQEPHLLVSLLRYAQQTSLDTFLTREDDVATFTKELQEAPARIGNFADAGSGLGDTLLDYLRYPYPIPLLGEDLHNTHTLITEFDTSYELRIGPNEELAFIHQNKQKASEERLRIPKQEIEDFMLGLVYQAKTGLGRTTQKQLLDVLKYQFSEELAEQVKRIKSGKTRFG